MIYHEEKRSFLEKMTKIRNKSHENKAYEVIILLKLAGKTCNGVRCKSIAAFHNQMRVVLAEFLHKIKVLISLCKVKHFDFPNSIPLIPLRSFVFKGNQ